MRRAWTIAVGAALLAAGAAGGCADSGADAPEREAVTSKAQSRAVAASAGVRGGGDAQPPATELTVEVNGDLLIHSPIFNRARSLAGGRGYAFEPMLRQVRPWIAGADLALCHVETPMAPGPPSGYPLFNTPAALARAIRATGWDACSTASNHSLDRGQSGIHGTRRALRRAGVRNTGSFTSARQRRDVLMLRAKGVKIAFLAYTATTNGIPLPQPWSVNLARAEVILRDARRARRAGAQVVLVNLHWGTEYRHEPDNMQRSLARRLARSKDITAIVGQHAHVVQPIRRVAGRWVVFGEGNLLSNQTSACCPAASQDGMLVLLHLRVAGAESAVKRVEYVPTWVRHPDYTVLPVGQALRARSADAQALRASWRRTLGVVGRGSALQPVPRRLPR